MAWDRQESEVRQPPPLHPQVHDPIERERCPECGGPGRIVRHDLTAQLTIWACPVCEPEQLEGGQ